MNFWFLFQLKRYKTYVYVLNSHMLTEQQNDFQNAVLPDETKIIQPDFQPVKNSRINNRTVIYNSDVHEADG